MKLCGVIIVGLFYLFTDSNSSAIAREYSPAIVGANELHDLSYGSDEKQKIDVYLPPQPHNAAIIVMVHGGGWRRGDKTASRVVENKVAHWLPLGFIFVSVNNRLLPATPLEQAGDVGAAIEFVRVNAAKWGGDASRLVLMGHSAGAHLVALLSANPAAAPGGTLRPWAGTVVLDSAAMDVNAMMERRHFRLYDKAWGEHKALWTAGSPLAQAVRGAVPMLLVCSSKRTDSCPPNKAFAAKLTSLGAHVEVNEQEKSHGEINEDLGRDAAYTARVDAFINSVLSPGR